jgi:hypothetical protein
MGTAMADETGRIVFSARRRGVCSARKTPGPRQALGQVMPLDGGRESSDALRTPERERTKSLHIDTGEVAAWLEIDVKTIRAIRAARFFLRRHRSATCACCSTSRTFPRSPRQKQMMQRVYRQIRDVARSTRRSKRNRQARSWSARHSRRQPAPAEAVHRGQLRRSHRFAFEQSIIRP